MSPLRTRAAAGLLVLLIGCGLPAWAAEQRLDVAPSALDPRVAATTPPHGVRWREAAPPGAPILVWLAGTGGESTGGPQAFFDTVVAEGYRLVILSYPTTPAVAQACAAEARAQDADCARKVRQQRVWGNAPTRWIDDAEQDAIVPRLKRLLRHLAAQEAPHGAWAGYLEDGEPRWSRIVVAGQSQGGGHAAFLAKDREVAGVLMFSGGWDQAARKALAGWYRRPSTTPPARWHSTHHAEESQADRLREIDALLGIPDAQRHALHEPVARNAHTEGVRNLAYRPLWQSMLRALHP